jgi:hypothetical protein
LYFEQVLIFHASPCRSATGQDAAGDAKSSPEEFLDYGPEDSVEYLPGDSEEPQDFKGYLDELKQKRQDRLTRRFD